MFIMAQLKYPKRNIIEFKIYRSIVFCDESQSPSAHTQNIGKKGIGFECVSIQELKRILGLFPNLDKNRMLFTPNFASKAEYQFAIDVGCYVTIDNVYPLFTWPELFRIKRLLFESTPERERVITNMSSPEETSQSLVLHRKILIGLE